MIGTVDEDSLLLDQISDPAKKMLVSHELRLRALEQAYRMGVAVAGVGVGLLGAILAALIVLR